MLNAVALLIPVFLIVVLFEWYISYKRQDNRYATGNTIMNLTIGAIDQVGSLFYFAVLYVVLVYVYDNFRLVEIDNPWYQWVLGYIAVDFLSYWYHRLSHRINILWAGHITHHSSEFFNFSNGFRTSLFQGINRIIFWAFLPVFGFSPVVLVVILKVSGIYDFLLHTEYIRKLGFLEKILITPSMHRVHHGKNDIYIDKNYGSTFVIWDKLFGTYQEETEKVVYGIKSQYTDNNPLMAIGHHYRYLWITLNATSKWSNKIKLLFMPPEWKPVCADAIPGPVNKNRTVLSSNLKHYAIFQLIFCVTGLIIMLAYINFLSSWEIILCSAIGIIMMSNITMLFNGKVRAGFANREMLRLLFSLFVVLIAWFISFNYYFLIIILFLIISLILNKMRVIIKAGEMRNMRSRMSLLKSGDIIRSAH